MVAHVHNLTVVQNDDHIRILHGGHPLGDDQLGGAGDILGEGLTDHRIGLGVHGGGGVIQNENLGLLQQRPGDAQPLLLTTGYVGAALLDVGIVAVRPVHNKLVSAGEFAGVDDLLVGGVGVTPAQIIPDGAGEQHVLLEHHGHVVPECLQVVLPHVHTAYLDGAFAHIVQPGNQLHQGGFGRTGTAQDTYSGAAGNVQVYILQGHILGSLAIAEGNILKVDRTVGNLCDRAGGGAGEVGLLGEDLVAALKRRAAHGKHHKHHTHHHKGGEDLGGVGEHGAELTGGQTQSRVVAGLDYHMGTQPGDGDHTAVYAELHDGAVQSHDPLGLAEIFVDGGRNRSELLGLLFLPDKTFDHPDAVDVLLDGVVQLVVGLEGPVKDLEHCGHQAHQRYDEDGQSHTEGQAQPYIDPHCADQRQDQHHRTADSHADHHLEAHLQIGNVGGEPGDDGRGGELINVGKAEALHMVEHIVAKVLGKAGAGLGGEPGRCHAEAQRCQSAEHQ